MPSLLLIVAFATAVSSAAALYAGSRHCRWASWRRLGRTGTWAGLSLAVVSLSLWIVALGTGAGLCAMLGTWMLAMMGLPYLAGMSVAPANANANADDA
ncbi:hypothetical protein [Pseudoxanthomonas putridarboris]|uniref:Uncharacterized protein n=1 Tax=Pseudoxanthomonas putridarboris TaxID=752605 RepID=A0ABU9J1L1_9GAMM